MTCQKIHIESFGIVRFPKKAFYYEKFLKVFGQFQPWPIRNLVAYKKKTYIN